MKGAKTLKSTGIVRKVDELGRVVIPIELRRTLNIAEKDALEICGRGAYNSQEIRASLHILRQCKGRNKLQGKNICPDCAQELKNSRL